MAPTIVQQIWEDLDTVTTAALTWPGVGKLTPEKANEENPWYSSEDQFDYLQDRIDFVKNTAVGRGLSIALYRLCAPAFESADDVVRLAVKRYNAKAAGEEMPPTPGFMGPGNTGDGLRAAGGQKIEPPTQTPSAAPIPHGPKKKSKLNTSAIEAIKMGLANGIDASMFADMYNVSIEEVKAVV